MESSPVTLSRTKAALVGRLRRRRTRQREGLFLVEGVRSAAEAVAVGAGLRFAVVAPRLEEAPGGAALLEDLGAAAVEIAHVDDRAMAGLADTESPQGVLLVCEEPRWRLGDVAPGPGGGYALLLDGLQDPGNLGTLVRAAAGFGVPAVVAMEGTVDPYNPKAVRAAAGGHFRVRVLGAPWDDVRGWLAREGAALLVGDAAGADVEALERPAAWALAVGNEGAGPRHAVRSAGTLVGVPMPGGAESLNAGVAGSILLYALTRETRGA